MSIYMSMSNCAYCYAVKHDISPVSTPLPSINRERVARPVAAAPNRMTNHDSSVHTSPAQGESHTCAFPHEW